MVIITVNERIPFSKASAPFFSKDEGGGFIEHYLIPMLYPSSLTRPIQIAIVLFVIAINLTIYLWPMVLSFKATSGIALNRCECATAFLHSWSKSECIHTLRLINELLH